MSCGVVVRGIGARAGTREVAQLLRSAQPRLLVSDRPRSDLARTAVSGLEGAVGVLVLDDLSLNTAAPPKPMPADAAVGPDDVFLINSTSGTTGMPKCVVHTQNRWHYFHQQAVANGLFVEDQSSFVQRDRIGIDNIMLEADYPHCDSTWPHTQDTIHDEIGDLPADAIRKITWENAARRYRHSVPVEVQNNPDAF